MNALALPSALSAAPRARDPDVERAVRRYCERVGADSSTTEASLAWADRAAGDTLQRVRAGRARADQLRERLERNATAREEPA